MNGRVSKKIHKEVNARIKYSAHDVLNTILEEKFLTRIKYAFKIIFKYKIGEKLGVKE